VLGTLKEGDDLLEGAVQVTVEPGRLPIFQSD
jgi:hypothetical protein